MWQRIQSFQNIFTFIPSPEYFAARNLRGMGTMRKEIEGDTCVDGQSANVTRLTAIQKETTA